MWMFAAWPGGVSTSFAVLAFTCCFLFRLSFYFITFAQLSLFLSLSFSKYSVTSSLGSPPLSVTSPHLRANQIASPLPQNLTFFLFYFEQRINPTASPPLLSCSSPRRPALAITLFLLSLSDSIDLLAVSHVHTDSSSMFLLPSLLLLCCPCLSHFTVTPHPASVD